MEVLFVGYPRCSTSRAAEKWLTAHHIPYTFRHIVEATPTAEELALWQRSSGLPLKRFFNTSGMAYRALELKDKLQTMGEEEQLLLLASDGMLIKRPIVVCDGAAVLLGFREKEYQEYFAVEK